jgi:hypothetical protein
MEWTGDRHTLVLVFAIPPNVRPRTATLEARELAIHWLNIPLCSLSPSRGEQFLGVCTQNFPCPYAPVARWVAWHRSQGFMAMTIYVNSLNETALAEFQSNVRRLTDADLLHLVLWQWPRSYPFHEQPATQMSCLYRSRQRVRWLAMNDVDELFVDEQNVTVQERLLELEHDFGEQADGVFGCNRWLMPGPRHDYWFPALRKADALCTYRGKALVRVANAYGFIVHQLTVSKHRLMLRNVSIVNAHMKRGVLVMNVTDYPYIIRFLNRTCTDYSTCQPDLEL